jgi:hypothetical protein
MSTALPYVRTGQFAAGRIEGTLSSATFCLLSPRGGRRLPAISEPRKTSPATPSSLNRKRKPRLMMT